MEIGIKCNRRRWCQTYQKAFIKVTNSRQRKQRRDHLDCSEHSNNCHMAPRWGLAQEICHGQRSAKSETMMSGGERGVSGQRGFASELFRKRPWEKPSPILSLIVLTEIKMQFADGIMVCPGKSSLLPSEMVAQTRTGTGKDHRDSIVQDKGFSDMNKMKTERGCLTRQVKVSKSEDAQRGHYLT